jgi:hypothetical protein
MAGESARCARPKEIKRKVASREHYTGVAGALLGFRVSQRDAAAYHAHTAQTDTLVSFATPLATARRN